MRPELPCSQVHGIIQAVDQPRVVSRSLSCTVTPGSLATSVTIAASDLSRALFYDEPAHEIDFTVTLSRPVPPECIKSHKHPMRIRDPLLGFTWHEEQEVIHPLT